MVPENTHEINMLFRQKKKAKSNHWRIPPWSSVNSHAGKQKDIDKSRGKNIKVPQSISCFLFGWLVLVCFYQFKFQYHHVWLKSKAEYREHWLIPLNWTDQGFRFDYNHVAFKHFRSGNVSARHLTNTILFIPVQFVVRVTQAFIVSQCVHTQLLATTVVDATFINVYRGKVKIVF